MCEAQKIATGYTSEDEVEVIAALEKIHIGKEKTDEFGTPIAPRTFVVISFVEYDDGVSYGVALFDSNQPVMLKDDAMGSAKIITNASISSVAAMMCAKDVGKIASKNLDTAQRVQLGAHFFFRDGGMKNKMMKKEMSESGA